MVEIELIGGPLDGKIIMTPRLSKTPVCLSFPVCHPRPIDLLEDVQVEAPHSFSVANYRVREEECPLGFTYVGRYAP